MFKDAISKKVQSGIADAMSEDVPAAVNRVLGTLPTHFALQVSARARWLAQDGTHSSRLMA